MKAMTHTFTLESGDALTVSSDGFTCEMQLQIFDKETRNLRTQVVTWMSPDDIDLVTRSMHEMKFHVRKNMELDIHGLEKSTA